MPATPPGPVAGSTALPRGYAHRHASEEARALAEQPADVVAAATRSVREALTPYVKGQTVPLEGAIWIVTAKAS